jgi:hypothetical protein
VLRPLVPPLLLVVVEGGGGVLHLVLTLTEPLLQQLHTTVHQRLPTLQLLPNDKDIQRD